VRYANGDEVEYVVTVFDCEILGGALIESNEETKGLAYFRPEEIPKLAFEYPREAFITSGLSYFGSTEATS
jgi:hypothetical protein